MRTLETSFKRVISLILCIAMTMQAGWAIAGKRANAATSQVDPELTVSLPDDIRVGEDYQVSVTTNSDGAVSYDYYTSRGAHLDGKPTSAGNYRVTVTTAETDNFNGATRTVSYEIWKWPSSGNVTLTVPATVYVGEDFTPQVTTISDGAQTITYRYNDLEGMPERSEKPTEPGSYLCLLHIAESDTYYECTTYKSFRIIKRTPNLSLTVPNTYVGQSYTPTVTNDSNGTAAVTYCNNNDTLLTFTSTKPASAGTYTAKVSVPETDEYYGAEYTYEFTISKYTPDATISVPDSYVGDSYEPSVTTNSDGTVSVYYLANNSDVEDEQEFSPVKPVDAGSYTAMAVISETDTYEEIECSDTFTISKRTPNATISVRDTWAGDVCSPTLSTDSDGAGSAVIEYKPVNSPDSSYTTTAPTTRGMYMVRATIPETAAYLGTSCTNTFEVKLRPAAVAVTVADPFAGTTYTPVIATESDGLSSAVIEYKEKNAPDTTYSTTQPTSYGSYMIRVTIPETARYEQTVGLADYKIVYLPAPENAYDLSGTKGNNDYYTSDVEIKAPEGYSISTAFNGTYGASVTYSDDLKIVYLKRNEDGALTAAVAVEKRPMIDKEVPAFSDSTGSSITDGSSVFSNSLLVAVKDDNLISLKVNGDVIDLASAGSVLTLTPGNGTRKFTIEAEDIAGNSSTIEFILMAEWLRDRIIPADLILPLDSSESYNLDSGSWTVSGDGTVYNGGGQIFVRESGDYTFSRAG